jgi:hypothetical protein
VRRKKQDIDETQEFPAMDPSFFDPVASGPVEDEDDPEDFLPPPRKRLGKTTLVLCAIVLIGGGFLIGITVQKHHGTSSRSGTSRFGNFAARGGSANFSNFASGATAGLPNFGGSGSTGSADAGSGASSATGVPAVIGTITKVTDNSIVVKNFGGKEITVKLTDKTAVSNATPTAGLKSGQTVTVRGTTSNGTVTATAVSAK